MHCTLLGGLKLMHAYVCVRARACVCVCVVHFNTLGITDKQKLKLFNTLVCLRDFFVWCMSSASLCHTSYVLWLAIYRPLCSWPAIIMSVPGQVVGWEQSNRMVCVLSRRDGVFYLSSGDVSLGNVSEPEVVSWFIYLLCLCVRCHHRIVLEGGGDTFCACCGKLY